VLVQPESHFSGGGLSDEPAAKTNTNCRRTVRLDPAVIPALPVAMDDDAWPD